MKERRTPSDSSGHVSGNEPERKRTIRIRPARAEDVHALVRFNRAMAWETERKRLDPALVAKGVRTVLDHAEHGFYVVAECASALIGSLLVTFEWSDWRHGRFWWIQSVYVRLPFRNKGCFLRLYAYVARQAERQRDVCGLRLYTREDNTVARRTYASLGMRDTGYRVYEQPLPHTPRARNRAATPSAPKS